MNTDKHKSLSDTLFRYVQIFHISHVYQFEESLDPLIINKDFID